MAVSNIKEVYVPNRVMTLEEFNNPTHPLSNIDLSFLGESTQHSTHALHTYVAAINPPLASTLIQEYTQEGQSILDPYCGGGGVLVEGVLNNRYLYGNDINPLAVLLAKSKTTFIPENYIQRVYDDLFENISDEIAQTDINSVSTKTRFWFKDYMLAPLLVLKNRILNFDEELYGEYGSKLKTLFKVILSATVRDVMLTYRGEVRLRKLQGEKLENFNPNVLDTFSQRFIMARSRVPELEPFIERCKVIRADIKILPYEDNQFDCIVTSPPYGDDKNGVGYFQFSKNMLYFLGLDDKDIKTAKNDFLGEIKVGKDIPPSESLKESLENVKNNGLEKSKVTHYKEAVAFYADYYESLKEMVRVTKDKIIIIIGNRVLSRTTFDNALITTELLATLNVNLIDYFQRSLPKKRIPNLGNDGGGMNIEHILVFEKYK